MQVAMKFDKRFFFDRQAVADIVGKKTARIFGKAGAYVQRAARSSMRRAGKKARALRAATGLGTPSPAGSPPRMWAENANVSLKNIQFQFVPQSMSVFVGPVKLNGRTGIVSGTMERGGVIRRSQKDRQVMAAKINRANGLGLDFNGRKRKKGVRPLEAANIRASVAYSPRPFMGPAMKREAPKFPTLFARGT